MKPFSGRVIGCAGLLCLALPCSGAFAEDPPTTAPAAPGVWQKHIYTFQFMGFTTTYSCDGLADKLQVLLIAAGARPDSKSRSGVCSRSYGRPDKFAQANLTFYTLAPAGADPNIVARGTWRPVQFAVRTPRELALGDCELVEQFRALVLPMFTTRNIDDQMTCIPHQDSGSVINLKFESFAALPAKPANTRDAHAAAPHTGT
ncbi:MAG: hypothetical protein ACLPV8_18715 [Steroidobacteraceae bacterium]